MGGLKSLGVQNKLSGITNFLKQTQSGIMNFLKQTQSGIMNFLKQTQEEAQSLK